MSLKGNLDNSTARMYLEFFYVRHCHKKVILMISKILNCLDDEIEFTKMLRNPEIDVLIVHI